MSAFGKVSFTLPRPGARCEEKVAPRSAFAPSSFRWIKRGGKRRKVFILVGCPIRKWNAKAERCRAGMKAHVVVRTRRRGAGCRIGRRG